MTFVVFRKKKAGSKGLLFGKMILILISFSVMQLLWQHLAQL
jgi:hypothetical protein